VVLKKEKRCVARTFFCLSDFFGGNERKDDKKFCMKQKKYTPVSIYESRCQCDFYDKKEKRIPFPSLKKTSARSVTETAVDNRSATHDFFKKRGRTRDRQKQTEKKEKKRFFKKKEDGRHTHRKSPGVDPDGGRVARKVLAGTGV
jgi:hypothetical protein